jgi:hypothetical protein
VTSLDQLFVLIKVSPAFEREHMGYAQYLCSDLASMADMGVALSLKGHRNPSDISLQSVLGWLPFPLMLWAQFPAAFSSSRRLVSGSKGFRIAEDCQEKEVPHVNHLTPCVQV